MTSGELHVIEDILIEVKRGLTEKSAAEIPEDWLDFGLNAIARAKEQQSDGNHQAYRNSSAAERPAKRHKNLPRGKSKPRSTNRDPS